MNKKIFNLLLVLSLSVFSTQLFAQGKGNGKGNGNGKNKGGVVVSEKKQHGPPPWAPANGYRKRHIYFPDYKTYYDNTKGVYISMNTSGTWVTTVDIPLSMKNVDLKVAAKVE